ncbi:MAG: hypothetical protein JJ896_03040 [Rhodothermales bacterium]|nr:hypothetical protein [Rhodothermales bacterium]MBO6778608.1 hypothetical protein [Rhodothermales bacterium]
MRYALVLILMLTACDSTEVDPGPDPVQTGPEGTWQIDPVSFQLNRVTDAQNGITQDIQATISGTLSLDVADGQLSGNGQCSWTTRQHTARTNQTLERDGTESFTVSGTFSDESVLLILSGCAWNQIGYRGTFTEGEGYDLSIRASGEGPLFGADVWSDARFVSGDDPAELRLLRP